MTLEGAVESWAQTMLNLKHTRLHIDDFGLRWREEADKLHPELQALIDRNFNLARTVYPPYCVDFLEELERLMLQEIRNEDRSIKQHIVRSDIRADTLAELIEKDIKAIASIYPTAFDLYDEPIQRLVGRLTRTFEYYTTKS